MPLPERTTQQVRNPGTNGTKPAQDLPAEKAKSAAVVAIDLSVDLSTLRLNVPSEDGSDSLLMYLSKIDNALAAYEAMADKRTAVMREVGARLHKSKIAKVRLHEGKSVAIDAKVGDLYRVRAINGSDPQVYQLYSDRPKKGREGVAPIDVDAL